MESGRGRKPVYLRLESISRGGEFGHSRLFLSHNRSRSAGNEAFVGQLGGSLRDLAFQSGDFLAQPLGLRGDVDLDVQCEPCRAMRRSGWYGR